MNFKILLIGSLISLSIGCANKKTKSGRSIQVTREENVVSCRFIGTVTGSSRSDALDQAATLDTATHLVWTGDGAGKVYSCD